VGDGFQTAQACRYTSSMEDTMPQNKNTFLEIIIQQEFIKIRAESEWNKIFYYTNNPTKSLRNVLEPLPECTECGRKIQRTFPYGVTEFNQNNIAFNLASRASDGIAYPLWQYVSSGTIFNFPFVSNLLKLPELYHKFECLTDGKGLPLHFTPHYLLCSVDGIQDYRVVQAKLHGEAIWSNDIPFPNFAKGLELLIVHREYINKNTYPFFMILPELGQFKHEIIFEGVVRPELYETTRTGYDAQIKGSFIFER
jgi:hypothetical protein